MIDKNDILDFLRNNKNYMKSQFGVYKIGLFGSYSRNDETENSDIDIAIELDSENSFRSFFNVKYYLEDAFSKHVDLGIESSFKPVAKGSLLKDIIYV